MKQSLLSAKHYYASIFPEIYRISTFQTCILISYHVHFLGMLRFVVIFLLSSLRRRHFLFHSIHRRSGIRFPWDRSALAGRLSDERSYLIVSHSRCAYKDFLIPSCYNCLCSANSTTFPFCKCCRLENNNISYLFICSPSTNAFSWIFVPHTRNVSKNTWLFLQLFQDRVLNLQFSFL